jgi:hypothetical protein
MANRGKLLKSYPTATQRPAEFTATEVIIAGVVVVFIKTVVVHVVPSVDVAYIGYPLAFSPTATYRFPAAFTATPDIYTGIVLPFMSAGELQTYPSVDVA